MDKKDSGSTHPWELVSARLTQDQIAEAWFAALTAAAVNRFFAQYDVAVAIGGKKPLPDECERLMRIACDTAIHQLPPDHPFREPLSRWQDEVAIPNARGDAPFLRVVRNDEGGQS